MTQTSDKQAVALSSMAASAGMVAMKLVVGLLTGSLGILSEAFHSGLDLGAATLTWAAVRVADQPADEEHPYGHGKFESLSALLGTLLLFLTAIGVAREAILHLLMPGETVEVTWYGVAVIILSMAIDFTRSRALTRVAKATGSQALEADALHFSSDILSSAVVLVGLIGVYFGIAWADSAAALGVSFFIAHAGWELGQRTLNVLVDAAPEGICERVKVLIAPLPGIARISWVRARPAGATIFVDVAILVSRTMPIEQVETVRLNVVKTIQTVLDNVQVLVIAEPLALDTESITQTVQVLSATKGLIVHSIEVAQVGEHPHVSFHMEVDADLTIAQAHTLAQNFEEALAFELGHEMEVDIHIDPRHSHVSNGITVSGEVFDSIKATVLQVVSTHPMVKVCHHLKVQKREDGLFVSFHCLFPDACLISDVHEEIESIEFAVKNSVSGLATVVVHPEPLSHPETDHEAA